MSSSPDDDPDDASEDGTNGDGTSEDGTSESAGAGSGKKADEVREDSPFATVIGGAGWVLGGRLTKLFLGFLLQILLARVLGNTSYGVLSIAQTVIAFAGLFAGLGVARGVERNVSFYEDEPEKARGIVRAGLVISLGSHVLTGVVLFLTAPIIATDVFGNADLTILIRIAAVGMPFGALRSMGISVATGSRDASTHTIVNQVLGPVTQSLLMGGFVVLGYGAVGAILGRTLATVAMAAVAIWLAWRVIPFDLTGPTTAMYRELLAFSLPLLFAAWMTLFIDETDYLMLGFFESEALVGTYTAMFGIRPLVLLFFFPATFLLAPVITRLQKQRDLGDARSTYQAISKWTTLASLPLFLGCLLFPRTVIRMTFGAAYLDGAFVLQILVLSGVVTVILGANDRVLIGLGHTRTTMYVSAAAAASNIVLNFALIPYYGMAGAAVASLTAFATRNVVNSLVLYRWHGLTPFSPAMIRVFAVLAVLVTAGYLAFVSLFPVTIISVVVVGVVFLIAYVPIVIRLGAAESVDREMLRQVEESTDVDLGPAKRLLNRFTP